MQSGNNRPCFARLRVITASISLVTLFLLAACSPHPLTKRAPLFSNKTAEQ